MGLLQSTLIDGGPRRVRRWLRLAGHPAGHGARAVWLRGWSERTVIALVMQSADNSLVTHLRKGLVRPRAAHHARGTARPNPTWIPAGNEAARLLAEEIGGIAGGALTEPFNVPVTAHILGGAAIGGLAGRGRDRRVPAGLRPPGPARASTARRSARTSASTRR